MVQICVCETRPHLLSLTVTHGLVGLRWASPTASFGSFSRFKWNWPWPAVDPATRRLYNCSSVDKEVFDVFLTGWRFLGLTYSWEEKGTAGLCWDKCFNTFSLSAIDFTDYVRGDCSLGVHSSLLREQIMLWVQYRITECSLNDGAVCWYGSKLLIMYSSVKPEECCQGTKLSLCGREMSSLSASLWFRNILLLSSMKPLQSYGMMLHKWAHMCPALYIHTLEYSMCALLHKNPCLCFLHTHTHTASCLVDF